MKESRIPQLPLASTIWLRRVAVKNNPATMSTRTTLGAMRRSFRSTRIPDRQVAAAERHEVSAPGRRLLRRRLAARNVEAAHAAHRRDHPAIGDERVGGAEQRVAASTRPFDGDA